ncbi:MAG: beta strand repeat-containing protein [Candidatus Binatia bacterium]
MVRRLPAFLLSIAVLLLSTASLSMAAVSFVKTIGTTSSTTTGTSLAITVPASGVAVGNRAIVTIALNPSSGTVACSDTGGNSYAVDRNVANGSGTSGVRTVILSAQVATALVSGNTITCTHPSVTARALSANEFSGLATTATLDKVASATGNNTAPFSGATTTTAQASELLIGGIGVEGPTTETFTAGASYATVARAGTSGGTAANNITINPEYRIVSATGAYSASGTISTSRKWATAIVTYKAALATIPTKLSITSINSGANPTAGVGFPVVVQAQDAGGIPRNVTNATGVSLSLKTGTGALGGTLTGTIAAGTNQVTISGVTYMKAQSGIVLTANRTSGDVLSAGDSSTFTVNPGAAAKVAFSVPPGDSTAGIAIPGPPAVTVQDGFGNTVFSSNASIALTLNSNPVGGQLLGTTTKSAASGIANFSGLSIDKAYFPYSLTASSTGLVGATSNAFEIEPGSASRLTIYPIDQFTNPIAGNGFEVLVIPTDAYNNKASVNATTGVSLSLKTGTGTLSGTLTGAIPAGEKEAYFFGVTYTKAESGVVITANRTSGDILTAGDSAPFTANPGTATKLAFFVQPGNTVAGSSLSGPPTVAVQDSLGNTVTSSSASITVTIGTNPSGGTLSGTTTRNAVSGLAAFTGLSINQVGNGYTLTASATGLTGATSNVFNLTSPNGGTIAGTITRVSNGVAITGAVVEAYQGTVVMGSASTNSSGNYSIAGLSAGTYAVRASFTGLVPQMLNNVAVTSGNTTTFNLSLNVGLAIQSPVAGTEVNDFSALVTGLFDTSLATEVGITVNGYVALIDGDEFAAFVPIDAQTTTLTATVTNLGGTSLATDAVPITPQVPTTAPPLFFRPSPAITLVSQPVGFTLTSVNPLTQIQLDGNGDGTIDHTGATLQGVTVTFAASGLYFPTVSVTEQGGSVRTATTIVQVFDSGQLDALLQTKWTAMKNALRVGDVSGAASHIALRRRATYEAMFNALTVPLANIDQVLTSISFLDQRGIEAEYEMMVNEGGVQYSFLVLFAIDEDGVWRVKFF